MNSYALPSLVERAKLAVNCLTHHIDPENGNIPFFYTRLSNRPPFAYHDVWSYGDGLGRSVDALALCRTMCGQSIDNAIDQTMLKTLISLIHDDGLSWCPARQWTLPYAHTRPAWLQQGTLLALTTIYQLTDDTKYRCMAEKNIDGILKIARSHGKYLDFPGEHYSKEHGWSMPEHEDPNHKFSVFSTSVTMPLMRFYRLTGYEPARQLASGLINWGLADHANGRKLFDQGHFHCQSRLLTALLMRGIADNSEADLELGEWLYLKARDTGTRAGWFPEQINNPEFNRDRLSETCCLTDMIESAILLAQHRHPQYWNDVERFARNYLLVHQYTEMDWIGRLTDHPEREQPVGYDHERHCLRPGHHDNAFKYTLIGGFAGWGGVSALSDDSVFSNVNQHCCNGAGARALYDVWYHSVTDDGNRLVVNLHLQRNHETAEVLVTEDEHLNLKIKMKAVRRLSVRIPDFVAPDALQSSLPMKFSDGFVELGEIAPGITVKISYPLRDTVSRERAAADRVFEYHWHGATVIAVTPFSGVSPLFVPERFSSVAKTGTVASKEIIPF